MSNFEMLRNANVVVTEGRNAQNFPVAIATINDRFQHHFDAKSRVSKALDLMSAKELTDRLSGGDFFFVNSHLKDYRDSHYNGFVHTEESIQQLMDVIGVTQKNDDGQVSLSTLWSEHEINVPLYEAGGDFKSQLRFTWNPFMKDVRSAFDLVRLICTNGMTGMTNFLNTKIPLVNRWEEHLEIASRQIQNKVSSKVVGRLGEMGNERATVADCQLIVDHTNNRLEELTTQVERERLRNIGMIASPMVHLGKMYRENVFSDRRLGAQLPSHLSTFDVYNMATEINTHTAENSKSSSFALDKFANSLIFDREDLTKHAARFGAPVLSSFSDPEAAFFGDIEK